MKIDRNGITGKLDQFIAIITIVITITAFAYTLYNRFKTKTYDADFDKIELLKFKLDSINKEITNRKQEALIRTEVQRLLVHSPTTDSLLIKLRLGEMSNNLNKYIRITEGLRQAFNPTKPEEVLTIVRLKDEVDELKQHNKDLEDKLKEQQAIFEDSIKRELATTSNSNYWIMVILIPLVLQFAYNIWKDSKQAKEAA